MQKAAIGVFDSGVGGLTVVKEMLHYLPLENIVYFGDIARMPYGVRSPENIIEIVQEILDWMLLFNIKTVLMACNTSSSLALDTVIPQYDFPIFGLIKPVASYINSISDKISRVGVIATNATVNSQAYSFEIKNLSPKIEVYENACPGLVQIIESGKIQTKETYNAVEGFIAPLLDKNVDKIVLGCTHYPFVSEIIKDISGNNNILINPAEYMVKEVKSCLEETSMINQFNPSPVRNFYVSDNPNQFLKVGSGMIEGVLDSNNVHLAIPADVTKKVCVS